MNLISVYYFLFLIISLLIYYIVPKRFQKYILLIISFCFFLYVSLEHHLRFILILCYITAVTYIGGGISSETERKIEKHLYCVSNIDACFRSDNIKVFI